MPKMEPHWRCYPASRPPPPPLPLLLLLVLHSRTAGAVAHICVNTNTQPSLRVECQLRLLCPAHLPRSGVRVCVGGCLVRCLSVRDPFTRSHQLSIVHGAQDACPPSMVDSQHCVYAPVFPSLSLSAACANAWCQHGVHLGPASCSGGDFPSSGPSPPHCLSVTWKTCSHAVPGPHLACSVWDPCYKGGVGRSRAGRRGLYREQSWGMALEPG